MMPHIIPGGRQRASSDGDVLEDEDDTINASGVLDRLTEAHRNVSRSAILTTDDDRDSDDPRSINDADKINKRKKKGLRGKISFKSVKKVVSKAFPLKDSLFGSSSSLNKEEMPTGVRTSSASGVWTPTLRRRIINENDSVDSPHKNHRQNRDSGENTGTDSMSRPLITDPGKMIAKWERTPGNEGLFNHGNTCFMNAVLQCLSHTDSFAEYFITDLYKDDLKNSRNSSKKIGSKGLKGDVTEQLSLLLKTLWSAKYNSEISIDFKAIVGKQNSQYKGSSQHDAQEFLLWLLDRVHEDLILPLPPQSKKKTKQAKSAIERSQSMTDEDLAEAAETGLTSSFVSQLFQGLHRSSLTCPHCGRHSNTFETYRCVSLPLPQKCTRPVYVIVVALREPNQSVMIGLSLNMYDTVLELRKAVSADTGIPSDQIVLCELTKDGFYATFSNEQPLSDIPESVRVYAIEMHPEEQQASSSRESADYENPTVQIILLHVKKGYQSTHRFCQPEVIQISRETNMKLLQREILYQLGDAVKTQVFQQHLSSLFQLQIVDGSSRRTYLPPDVEMPLYTQSVDKVLSMFSEEFGPHHLKLIVEWESEIKEAVIQDDEEHIVEHASVGKVRSQMQNPVTVLEDCFKLYTQEEKLADENAWLCPHCKKPQKGATKTLGLWSLPEILVLHLKRFKQTGLRRNKLNTLVEFPVENLNMATHVVQHRDLAKDHDNTVYDLIGVTNHYGNMMGGHYTAYCKNTVDGTWQEFDDRRVRPLADTQVVSNSAYILFYQRRSLSKLINQRLFTGQHWVFALHKHLGDKSSSPQRSRGSPVKKGTLQEDLEQVAATTAFDRRDRRGFSKEWNGQSSPTRRPASRPLTPQPQRRQSSLELGLYDQSPTVIKPRPSFRTSRPSLSRQVSKKLMQQEPEEPGRPGDRGDAEYSERHSASQIQPQILQVQLPLKGSGDQDVMASEVPRPQNTDILQPQQVHLPSKDTKLSSTSQQRASSSPFKGSSEQSREVSQSSKVPTATSGHHQIQPSSVDMRGVDSSVYRQHPDQARQQPSLVLPSRRESQRDSYSSQTGRPWQYESQSSRSSHETQSSHEMQRQPSSPHNHESPRSQCSNGNSDSNEFYDWRQPEARVNAKSEKRSSSALGSSPAKPATSVTSPRVMNKPPLPPKVLTPRPVDTSRSDSRSTSSPMHRQDDYLVTAATPSLTSPPSPAPKDSVRDIQRRLENSQSRQDHPLPEPRLIRQESRLSERPTQVERFIALNDEQQWGHGSAEGNSADRHLLKDGEFESRRRKIESQIPDQPIRRRRSQNTADQKFATIARGNRDARSEPREIIAPPMVPRSSTDHSIHFNNYGKLSPSHIIHHSPRLSAGYSPLSDRGSLAASSGYPRMELDRSSGSQESPSHVPLYARDNNQDSLGYSLSKETRPKIYRGPMFQRPKKNSGDISAPSLRESAV